jgi:hypothetical protein
MTLAAGTRLGACEIVARVGSGRMQRRAALDRRIEAPRADGK